MQHQGVEPVSALHWTVQFCACCAADVYSGTGFLLTWLRWGDPMQLIGHQYPVTNSQLVGGSACCH